MRGVAQGLETEDLAERREVRTRPREASDSRHFAPQSPAARALGEVPAIKTAAGERPDRGPTHHGIRMRSGAPEGAMSDPLVAVTSETAVFGLFSHIRAQSVLYSLRPPNIEQRPVNIG